MKRIRLFEIISATIMLSLTAMACISSVGAVNADKLEDVTWVLKAYGEPNNLEGVIAGSDVTLTFDKDKHEVKGNGGVNGYGGNYEVDGNELTTSDIVHTMMASTDQSLNDQENAFFNILQSAQSFNIDDEQLMITGTEGVLVFLQK